MDKEFKLEKLKPIVTKEDFTLFKKLEKEGWKVENYDQTASRYMENLGDAYEKGNLIISESIEFRRQKEK